MGIMTEIRGEMVSKNALAVQMLGKLEELDAEIGLLRTTFLPKTLFLRLKMLQVEIRDLMSFIGNKTHKLPDNASLSKWIEDIRCVVTPKGFVYSGDDKDWANAQLNKCRVSARSAERLFITYAGAGIAATDDLSIEDKVEQEWAKYLNALSKYFYLLIWDKL